MEELFGKDLWSRVGKDLRGVAGRWWEVNRHSLQELTKEEVQAIAESLKDGDSYNAKLEIAARMSREEWTAYRDGTTDQLHDIAARRAQMLDALEDLGRRSAKAVGKAVVGALL